MYMYTPPEAPNLHAQLFIGHRQNKQNGICILAQEHAMYVGVLRYYTFRCTEYHTLTQYTPGGHKECPITQCFLDENCSCLALYTASYMQHQEHGEC